MEATFWSQFWPALTATLIGAFAGVFFALYVDRVRERRARRAEELAILRLIGESIENNLGLLETVGSVLEQKGNDVPAVQVEAAILDAVFPRFAQVSSDAELTSLVAAFRWGLRLVDRTLDHLVTASLHPIGDIHDPAAKLAFEKRAEKVAAAASAAVSGVEKLGKEELLPRLKTRLGLSPPAPAPHKVESPQG